MGVVRKDYGDACEFARTVARHGEAMARAREQSVDTSEWFVVEAFIVALHEMPAWALRSIADKIDPELPEPPREGEG